uniref:Uncharacterized protein n=1 Tax=Arundo donax TaxID=35708 RepID=A0A0A8YHW5_ARUDO
MVKRGKQILWLYPSSSAQVNVSCDRQIPSDKAYFSQLYPPSYLTKIHRHFFHPPAHSILRCYPF